MTATSSTLDQHDAICSCPTFGVIQARRLHGDEEQQRSSSRHLFTPVARAVGSSPARPWHDDPAATRGKPRLFEPKFCSISFLVFAKSRGPDPLHFRRADRGKTAATTGCMRQVSAPYEK